MDEDSGTSGDVTFHPDRKGNPNKAVQPNGIYTIGNSIHTKIHFLNH